MRAELSFLVVGLCVILSVFQIHGSSDATGHAADVAFSPAVSPVLNLGRHEHAVTKPSKVALGSHSLASHSFHKAPATYDSRRATTLPSTVPSKSPFQHTTKSLTDPESIVPEISAFKHHHHHRHGHHHHEHSQRAKLPYSKPAAGPLNARPAAGPLNPRLPQSYAHHVPIQPPSISPSSYSVNLIPPPSTLAHALPPPPPNQDCTAVTCPEPYTSTLTGSPCGCVLPIKVKLQLNVSIYTFFPFVSELASEIASSLSLNRSQVRIMGADAANQQPEKTIALIYLIPLSDKFKFDNAFSMYQKFWRKKVHVKYSLFGAYDVLDVHYPGLPPSPPSLSSNLASIDDHSYPANHKENGGSSLKPLGVDVPRKQNKGFSRRVAAVIIISCFTVIVTCAAVVWMLIASCRSSGHQREAAASASSFTKPSGAARSLALGSRSLSESMSFSSTMLNAIGYAKIYSLHEIEKATDSFDSMRVLGEGGFGVVYRGTLDDGEQVAVKVLKKDNRHGAREFLSEVEMLSRLHHRNLVKLLGICTEEHIRCLVYELVPNGSVESHLHGIGKEDGHLDWTTRMKIALGAARGLAYLHEDSSPCVIHRDFKASNILLEHDFTPKVSDFGLATNASNGADQPIATQVIGTFGYLAPEYAMTGHLLVKSDVYSYGVVLLELLSGRKPVDFSNPPGQENLVAWAQPLLTSNEGLEMIMDPNLNPIPSFDSFTKVAAIASMCVQPEVSRRPFMGEVVQALKLVFSELNDANDGRQTSSSPDPEKVPVSEFREFLGGPYPAFGYESCPDAKISLSAVDLVSASAQFEDIENENRKCRSGPLRKRPFWLRLGRFYKGSMRERLWQESH
ncbi:receptor-like serine/threonine-protein kinase ALE2 isoform X2 [Silene latifolia]|uniref:receptor-like serine/threonine-protein kinase ALE2 isoform X2 n=1 Tax=Silene latifolia TaxID=37657 RepID=UPI003D779A45